MRKYFFQSQNGSPLARTVSGHLVKIPICVFNDQRGYDGKTFPVIEVDTMRRKRAKLRGDLYGLNTPGTGDPIVSIV